MIQEVARGDHGLASTGFISPWSIAALSIPKPNEVLLKKFVPLLLGDEVFIIASAITEPHAGGSVEDIKLKGRQIRTRARVESPVFRFHCLELPHENRVVGYWGTDQNKL
jgi:hypothetical protein